MTDTEAEQALQERLATLPFTTITYENQVANPARPFLFVEHVPVSQTDKTTAGGKTVYAGYMSVTIICDPNAFVTPAREIADKIEALFPKATRIETATGIVTIDRPLQRVKGFPQGDDYRMPVKVYYRAS